MLDQITLDPIVASIAALLGVLLGIALGQVLLPGPRKAKRLAAEMEEMRREHAEYRARVSGHFHKTSDLIGQMTASYKAVYDHLSEGAQTLCADNLLLPRGAFSSPRLIVDDTVEVSHEGVMASPARDAASPQAAAATAAPASVVAAPPTLDAPPSASPLPTAPAAADARSGAAQPEAAAQWRFDVGGTQATDPQAGATPEPAVSDDARPSEVDDAPAPRASA